MKILITLAVIIFAEATFAISAGINSKVAEGMYSEGEYKKAIAKCEEALSADSTNEKCLQIIADSKNKLEEERKRQEAKKLAEKKKLEEIRLAQQKKQEKIRQAEEETKKQKELANEQEKQKQAMEEKRERPSVELASTLIEGLDGYSVSTYCKLTFLLGSGQCVDNVVFNQCLKAFNVPVFINGVMHEDINKHAKEGIKDINAKSLNDLKPHINRLNNFCS